MTQISKKDLAKWPDIALRHLIFSTDNFIVFIDEDLDLDWMTNDAYHENFASDKAELNSIIIQAAKLETIPNSHQSFDIRLNFKRMIGEAIARALEEDFSNAQEMLADAEQYIKNRNIEKARYWQLLTSIITASVAGFLALFLWSQKELFIAWWGFASVILLLSSLGGATGATLSIIFRMGNTSITSEAERSLHVLEGFARVFGGGIVGFIMACLVKAGFIFPTIVGSQNYFIAIVGISTIAGCSERLAPSLLSIIEKNVQTNRKDTK